MAKASKTVKAVGLTPLSNGDLELSVWKENGHNDRYVMDRDHARTLFGRLGKQIQEEA